jgi:hypothetical protein
MFHELAAVPEIAPDASRQVATTDVAPPPSDPAKATAFFTDLDSYTEYWDVYRPELKGKYMKEVGVLFGGSLKKWFALALGEHSPEAAALLQQLTESIAEPAAVSALSSIDDLLFGLLRKHFPGAGADDIDFAEYVSAVEWFARDLLPPDDDRLGRVPQDDDRYAFAGRHRMDGASMWFSWAGVVDCVAILQGDAGLKPHRAAQIAASAFGSAMDFTFRGQSGFRGKTRLEYRADEATAIVLRDQVQAWRHGKVARSEARDLYRIFSS